VNQFQIDFMKIAHKVSRLKMEFLSDYYVGEKLSIITKYDNKFQVVLECSYYYTQCEEPDIELIFDLDELDNDIQYFKDIPSNEKHKWIKIKTL